MAKPEVVISRCSTGRGEIPTTLSILSRTSCPFASKSMFLDAIIPEISTSGC